MQAQTQAKTWHVENWGTWGWAETAVKGIGIAAGLIAFSQASAAAPAELTGVTNIAAVVLIGLFTLLTLVVIALRVSQREIVSIVYSVFNALGHAGMLFYLTRTLDSGVLPVIFGLAYVVGELIKQRFLVVSGYTENGAQTPQMVMFSRGLMIAYGIFTVLVLV